MVACGRCLCHKCLRNAEAIRHGGDCLNCDDCASFVGYYHNGKHYHSQLKKECGGYAPPPVKPRAKALKFSRRADK